MAPPTKGQTQPKCFLAFPAKLIDSPTMAAVMQGAKDALYTPTSWLDLQLSISGSPSGGWNDRGISEAIIKSDCVLADVTDSEPSVFLELGLAKALGKPIFLISQQSVASPSLYGMEVITYSTNSSGLKTLRRAIGSALRAYRRFPRSSRLSLGSSARSLFAVDWDRISREDIDNLCLEVLSQLGFKKLEWLGKNSEVDMLGELPKRDPDGYEFKELWFISTGRNAPADMFYRMVLDDPEYFLHRMSRFTDRASLPVRRDPNEPITFLFISVDETSRQQRLFEDESRSNYKRNLPPIRVRFWDRNYLTNLVYQFPPIGFKYFSDEGRSRSKFRKTPEQLYEENLSLSRSLILEKDRRVRAERDAVWKDISSSAAHKMGNPLFAIETNLDPLTLRIDEGRTAEAKEVVRDIHVSVEKAKQIVAQFKQLTLTQKIARKDVRLRPILVDATKMIEAQSVFCKVECPEELTVYVDPVQISECFDELVCNTMNWFDKQPKTLSITAHVLDPDQLPDALDSQSAYVVVHVTDNGVGVPTENKSKIFDAFFTTSAHGTGLGLALARRMIEGNHGAIMETGKPGVGADFEVYLPLPDVQQIESQPETVDGIEVIQAHAQDENIDS